MARYNGFDYDKQEPVSRTRTEWREWIAHAQAAGCWVRGELGETFVHRRVPAGQASLVAEIYATPSQLGVRQG